MAKKKKADEGQESPAWLVLFTSLTIILVAFFVMLNSFASKDNDAVRDAIGSLRGSFGIMSGGFKPAKMDVEQIVLSPLEIMESELTLDSFFDSVMQLFKSIDVKRIKISKDKSKIRITFPGAVLFEEGNAKLIDSSFPILDKFISELAKIDKLINIEGHTDKAHENSNEFLTNWDLSVKRAVKVTEYFEQKGIAKERLKAIGFSMYKPLKNLVLEYDDSLNRRVEIIIFFDPDKEEELNGFQKRRSKKGSFEVDVDFF